MRVLFLGNDFAKNLINWLMSVGEEVVCREDRISIEDVRGIKPDFIVSYNYRYIIPKEIIDFVDSKAINLHISYLPYNRGAHPNIWSFLEDTPKGVTIHYIDEGIDTGGIIVQKEVFIDENKETLRSSYEILHKESHGLFKENWNKIKNCEIVPQPQTGGGGANTLRENLLYSNHLSEKGDGRFPSWNLENDIKNGSLNLKDVREEDIDDLFKWRNHPDVRKNSFNTASILWDEHKKWFKAEIEDPNTTIYIACCNEQKIGSIRFEDRGEAIKVSVMLNPGFLGKGLGSEVIRLGTERFIKEKKPDKSVHAEIKKDNLASIKAFQKAGYKESHVAYIWEKKDGNQHCK